jgi:hypothetical protein
MKLEDITVDEMYVVLALFILMGIIQKPTLRSYYSKNQLLFHFSFSSDFTSRKTSGNNKIYAFF